MEELKVIATTLVVFVTSYFVFFKIFKINKAGPIPLYASPVVWGFIGVIAFIYLTRIA